eukprot:TRINITY_DN20481_c0_g2_i1.p2 TRINITY_DN20481_c0_g2~~TRINITY_DN20481_c0_g2_i1.p2  ORF type:complete len:347 (+),score=69.27 TRINITY_DN20481_c0_g2_i1:166-1206(+)
MCHTTFPPSRVLDASTPAASLLLGMDGLGKRPADDYAALLAQPLKRRRAAEGLLAGPDTPAPPPVLAGSLGGLLEAVRSGSAAAVRAELPGASASALAMGLLQAVAANKATLARILLEAGASAEAKDFLGCPALVRAAEKGHARLVRLLLAHGADAAAKDGHGFSALHKVAASGNAELAEQLLEAHTRRLNADKSLSNDQVQAAVSGFVDGASSLEGLTALHQASLHGREALVRLLVRYGAAVQLKSGGAVSCLHMAACSGHAATAAALLEHGADPAARDDGGRTACHYACSYGHSAVLKALVRHGARTDVEDSLGVTPLGLLEADEAESLKGLLAAARPPLPMRF